MNGATKTGNSGKKATNIRRNVGGTDKPAEAVMLVPYMRDSLLKKALQTGEETLTGFGTVRYFETTGMTMDTTLVKKDPWDV